MAINQTGAIYKSLEFDGESSRTYGVYITGAAVYNAPARDVEMIAIPGRNGAFALDRGRFENITVTYPAGIFADTETDFAEAISDFRNFLCSRSGYCRLTDEYNPDEYRLAVYKSGLEVDTALLRAGEFEITFECKPQRYLTGGETAVAVTSGDTLTNPTLFEASPLLIAEGTGKITVNGTDIRIQNSVVGDCGLCYDLNVPGNYYLAGFTNIYIATGNIIETESINYTFAIYNADSSYTFTSQSITNVTGNPDVLPNATDLPGGEAVVVTCRLDDEAYSFRTALSKTIGFDVNITNSNGDSATIHVEVTAAYDGNKIIEYSAFVGYVPEAFYLYNPMFQFTAAPSITIHSTAATFGNPTYIDCDIGEAYADLGGTISPLNRYIELGSKLPTLAIGNTEITFDNTIATLKVVPRWWKI